MNDRALLLLWALLRTGLVLSVSASVLSVLLRVFRIASPAVRRTAYVAVLLQGCLLFQGLFALPLPKFVADFVAGAMTTAGWDKLAPRAPAHHDDASDGEIREPLMVGRSATGGRRRLGPTLRATVASLTTAAPTVVAQPGGRGSGRAAFYAEPRRTGSAGASPSLPADVVSQPSSTAFSWSLALVGVWAAGMILLAGQSAWAYLRFVRRLPPGQAVEPGWAAEWESLQREAGIRSPAALAVADEAGPVLCRLPHGYRLIVPAFAWRALEPAQRTLVLRHELAHIERGDVWKSLAIRVLALPHWFNPLVWRVVRRFDECAEWACDEATGRAVPEGVADYARALLQLSQRAEPIFFATRAAREHGLSQRIRRLLTPAKEEGSKMKTALMATLLLVISLANVTRLQTQASDGPPADYDKRDAPQTPAAPVAKSVADVVPKPTKSQRRITVMVPITTTIMVPTTVMVPATTKLVDKSPATKPVPEARLAKVDLQWIQSNMRGYQRERDKLSAEFTAWKQAREIARNEMLHAAQERINQEKDPVIKEVIQRGMAEKNLAMTRETDEHVSRQATDLTGRVYAQIVDEVARYAKEHHFLVVRRMGRSGLVRRKIVPQRGAAYGEPMQQGSSHFAADLGFTPTNGPFGASESFVAPDRIGSRRNGKPWQNEFLYVEGQGSSEEVDITNDILERLDASDLAKEKAANPKAK